MKKKLSLSALIGLGVTLMILIIGYLEMTKINNKDLSFPFKLTEVNREEEVEKFVTKSITDMGEDINFGKVYYEGYNQIMTKKEYSSMTTNIMFNSYIESLKDEKENTINIKEKELDKEKLRKMIESEVEKDLR